MRQRRSIAGATLVLIVVSAAIAGCGGADESRAPRWGLIEEYVDPAGPGGANTLLLYGDGGFQLRHCPRELCDSDSPSVLVAEGTWERNESILVLSTSEWEAMFVSSIVPMEHRGRSDTLRGLQWMQSSSVTPVDTCRFVRRSEFVNFVHPPEGSGASGW